MVGSVAESLKAYQEANSWKNEIAKRRYIQDLHWEAPKNDFVKVNWDAAIDMNRKKMGVGVGEVLPTLSSPRQLRL